MPLPQLPTALFFVTRDQLAVATQLISVESGARRWRMLRVVRSGPTFWWVPRLLLPAWWPAGAASHRHHARRLLEQLATVRCADAAGKLRVQNLRARVSVFTGHRDARTTGSRSAPNRTVRRRAGSLRRGSLVRLAISRLSVDDWVHRVTSATMRTAVVASGRRSPPTSTRAGIHARVRDEAEFLRSSRWRSTLRLLSLVGPVYSAAASLPHGRASYARQRLRRGSRFAIRLAIT